MSRRSGVRSLWSTALVAAAALAGVVATSGCGGVGADASAEVAPTAIPVRAVPRRGGELRLTLEAPQCIDPAEVQSVYDALPVAQIFDGLVALDAGLNVVPALADTWTISRDGRTYVFHLRDGVRFHDGSPLTADDVVFSIKRLLDPARSKHSVGASYLEVVEGAPDYMAGRSKDLRGVRAISPSSVEIVLSRPYISFLEVLAMDDLRIVPRSYIETRGEAAFRRAPIGTGPFKLGRWTRSELHLDANPSYFGGAPYLDEVTILFPDPAEPDGGNGRFLRKETDIVEPSSDALPRLRADPTVEIHRYQELSLSFLGLQSGLPPLNDRRIRLAIAHAIDRKALAAISPATRREATGILPPGLPGYSPTPKVPDYDPEASRRLLAQAGHPGGRGIPPIVMWVSRSATTESARTNAVLRANLAAVGLDLQVRKASWPELSARVADNDAPAFQIGWVADLPDPDSFLRTLFEPGGSANYFGFLDRGAAAALEAGAREMNPVERARIYRGLERSILDAAPLVPLFHTVGMIASRTYVHGFKPGPMGIGAVDLAKVWIDPEGDR